MAQKSKSYVQLQMEMIDYVDKVCDELRERIREKSAELKEQVNDEEVGKIAVYRELIYIARRRLRSRILKLF